MSDNVLRWVVTPLVLVLIVLLRFWGNRVMNRRRQREAEAEERRKDSAR